MRTLVAVTFCVVTSTTLTAQEKKYESKEGRYSVSFPGKPRTESKKVGETTMHTASVEVSGVAYLVIYADLPAEVTQDAKPAAILVNGVESLVKSFGAKVSETKETTFGEEKYPARNVTAVIDVEGTTLHLRITLVLVKGRVYQVLAMGTKQAVFGPKSDSFYKSFEITK